MAYECVTRRGGVVLCVVVCGAAVWCYVVLQYGAMLCGEPCCAVSHSPCLICTSEAADDLLRGGHVGRSFVTT